MTTQTLPPVRGPETASEQRPGRTLLRMLGVLFALAAIGFSALSIAGSLGRATSHHVATYEGIGALEVSGFDADVEVIGSDRTSVRVDRTISWSLREPRVVERVEGDTLLLQMSCGFDVGRGCAGDFELAVPRDIDVRISAADGGVTLTRLTGSISAATSDGSISLRSVEGSVRARTSDGSIEGLGLRTDTVAAQTSDGHVRLDFLVAPRSVSARTSDGGVEVLVPRGQESYAVSATTTDGDREVNVRTDPASDRQIVLQTSDGSVLLDYRD